MAGETMTRPRSRPKGFESTTTSGRFAAINITRRLQFLSFDNFSRSAIIVLQTITIDGWNESAKLAADASGIARGSLLCHPGLLYAFYALQLFTLVMIITPSLIAATSSAQQRRGRGEERQSTPIRVPRSTLQEDKVGEFVNRLGKTSAHGFGPAKFKDWHKGRRTPWPRRKPRRSNRS